MNDKRFWDIIARCCPHDESSDDWGQALHDQLIQLPAQEIVHFDWLFDARTAAACTIDLWGAAYLINGGASDDGFFYFRCWLVGMGKKVYEAALKNPDSLADVVSPDEEYESDIYAIGRHAWHEVTGQPEETPIDDAWLGPRPQEELTGEDWDFEDDAAVRRHFPRLAAMYLDEEGEDE